VGLGTKQQSSHISGDDAAVPDVSFVIPVFNEAENLPLLHVELCSVIEDENLVCEIIFIDDASTDSTPKVIQELIRGDNRVKGISLLRNTKKAGALSVGFQKARGKIIITLDGDLQDDPKEIPRLLAEIRKGADAVTGWKKHRRDSLKKRIESHAINRLTNLLLGQSFHDMNSGLKAYRSDVIQNTTLTGSNYRFLPHLLILQGARVHEIPVNHRFRKYGQSKFELSHRLRGPFDLLTIAFLSKYGDRPFHFFGWIGLLFVAVGFSLGVYLTVVWLQGYGIGSRPLLSLSVLLMLLGVQFASIGLIGELFVNSIGVKKPHPTYRSLN